MVKPDCSVYEKARVLSEQVLAAAENQNWDDAIRLQNDLSLMFEAAIDIQWANFSEADTFVLKSIIEDSKRNLARVEALFVERQNYLADALQQFNTVNKINRAYLNK